MARLTLGHRLARIHPFVWIGAAAALAGLVAWPLGGWDTVELESTKIPEVAVGELVEGHQFSLRIQSAELTDVHPNGFSEDAAGWTWLVLGLEVTNETDLTEFSSRLGGSYDGAVSIDAGVAGLGTTAVDADGRELRGEPYLVSDGTYLPDLQPDLPTSLLLVFQVPETTWSAGDELQIGIIDRTPYESTLGTGIRYGFPAPVAIVKIRVAQGATPAPTAEPAP
ncbi:MAG TPA: hypothetical protein VNR36_10070 [Pseudolysinimonas sp.]|nr:hypothetical protein [Pseudolysinimonas sp.]